MGWKLLWLLVVFWFILILSYVIQFLFSFFHDFIFDLDDSNVGKPAGSLWMLHLLQACHVFKIQSLFCMIAFLFLGITFIVINWVHYLPGLKPGRQKWSSKTTQCGFEEQWCHYSCQRKTLKMLTWATWPPGTSPPLIELILFYYHPVLFLMLQFFSYFVSLYSFDTLKDFL